ncbi:signal peptidase I [Enterococcus villorum]|uniref:Signal peptidase I n=2 Tax=Enterococcus villorum TaxID=112904 RepID=A0A511IZN5_9ENTE|nr:signal peptidase I [Enterococcus villorum]EOH89334.1 signal peptidase I [Enterococcus villorum ATCC 700913]EOW76142.1 signal peptidase I [Enterococcus villorum ATCC 700913]GEL91195.1 signal peptidase I [Enterococcus villorum]
MPVYKKITYVSSITLIVLLAVVLSIVLLPKLFGITTHIIEDRGMSPYYSQGSLIYVRPKKPEELLVGDVITYYENSGEQIITRRVIAVGEDHQNFYTKADSASQTESGVVGQRYIIGTPIFQIPYIGIFLSKAAFVWMRWLFLGIAFCLTGITAWNMFDEFEKKKNSNRFFTQDEQE